MSSLQMMRHAWDGYSSYAWGKNELRPVSKRGHSASIFGSAAMGASIIDGMVSRKKYTCFFGNSIYRVTQNVSDLELVELLFEFPRQVGRYMATYCPSRMIENVESK